MVLVASIRRTTHIYQTSQTPKPRLFGVVYVYWSLFATMSYDCNQRCLGSAHCAGCHGRAGSSRSSSCTGPGGGLRRCAVVPGPGLASGVVSLTRPPLHIHTRRESSCRNLLIHISYISCVAVRMLYSPPSMKASIRRTFGL